MTIEQAQREVRSSHVGGFAGLLVSAALWATSASLGTWVAPRPAILVLVVGGMLIYPISQGLLRGLGHTATISPGNPMRQLAMQAAFIIPAMLPVVGAAAVHNVNWFYPALMVVVGAHYFPFAFLYGMPHYVGLGGVLVAAGVAVAYTAPSSFSTAGWIASAIFLACSMPLRSGALSEAR